MISRRLSLAVPMALVAACSSTTPTTPATPSPPSRPVTVTVDATRAIATVAPELLSFAVDTAEVVGGDFWASAAQLDAGSAANVPVPPFDFTRPRLHGLARALAPAYLRIGGTDADRTHVDLSDAPGPAPTGYAWVLTKSEWDVLNAFAIDAGLHVMFTLNAGPSSRDSTGKWLSNDASALLSYTASAGYPVTHWELGNEVNAYGLVFGVGDRVSTSQYADDLRAARALLTSLTPSAKLVAPATVYWPTSGEVVPFLADFLAQGAEPDVVSWHFYPMQSERCPIVRRASLDIATAATTLDEVGTWATEVEGDRTKSAPSADVWLGESGNAQCGGEPGVSDTFASTFWWLDELGQLSAHGEPVVVRQTLAGADYGMLDPDTLDPRPDYWGSVLWKRWLGEAVLAASSNDPLVRAYAHCAKGEGAGTIAVVAMNLDPANHATVSLAGIAGDVSPHVLTGATLDARTVTLDGVALSADESGASPSVVTAATTYGAATTVDLPPLSIGFVLVRAGAAMCP